MNLYRGASRFLGRTIWIVVGGNLLLANLLWMQAKNPAQGQLQAQSVTMGVPGAVFNSQINSQQRMLRQSTFAVPQTRGIRDDIIFTDRFKNPISQQEFIQQMRDHHAEIYSHAQSQSNTERLEPFIEPPPPEDASFQ